MVSEAIPNPPTDLDPPLSVPPVGRKLQFVCDSPEQRTPASAAAEWAAEARDQAAVLLHRARSRMRQIVDEYPVHVVAAAAGAAFLAGLLLRIWRDSDHA
jgi:ElaB/YqjD/DUF883 family membrane-anchored ribosome-binding protein